jgi:hypothetical protein
MSSPIFPLTIAVAVLSLFGCRGVGERAGVSAPDLTGAWTFKVNTGQHVTQGAMTLIADGPSYGGTLTTDQGDNVLKVRSLTLDGSQMLMAVESPQGVVTFDGVLSADARSFDGVVTYHTGQKFPMTGVRR